MSDKALPEHLNGARQEDTDARKSYYRRLFRKFILVTLVCSLLPLLGVGWLINLHYTRFSKARMMDSFHTQVEQHRRTIELYLRKLSSKLYLASHTVSREYLTTGANLAKIFETINYPAGSITDLGVIDQDGRHLAYVGPYDLMGKNYSDTFWFKEAMKHGLFISDMFLGFRKVPHFIIAVTREEAGQQWILRATVDTEAFRSLLENVRIGKTGEVYLVNTQGIFQSSPRVSGKIMEKSPLPLEAYHTGIRIQDLKPRADSQFRRQIVAQAWLEHPRWLLVVKQDYAEAFETVNHANRSSLIFLHLSALSILIVSVLTARYLIGVIQKRDAESDRLNSQLLQTGKLASIGELSAGVAHEINNPLSIILTERQILLDLAGQTPALDKGFEEQLKDSLSQVAVQVQRCKRITQNLLKFSRRTKSVLETIDLNVFLKELIELVDREAKTSGITFRTELQDNLPRLLSDPSQLQQVFLNLVTNAIDAHDGKPYGAIGIRTHTDDGRQGVVVTVSDTGAGIRPEHLEKIFDPFFTTKEVGKGTGLGLSITYGIVKRLGGDIEVQTQVGEGTQFTVFLPCTPPPNLKQDLEPEA